MGLKFLDLNDENPIYNLRFPVQMKNPVSPPELEVHLWNKKGETCAKLASNLQLSVVNYSKTISGGTAYDGQDVIDENLVEAKSDGIVGSGIVDDAQASFTPIGATSSLSIGDIPVNCARKLFFRFQSTALTSFEDALFFIKVEYDYNRTRAYTYLEALTTHLFFGDEYFLGGYFL